VGGPARIRRREEPQVRDELVGDVRPRGNRQRGSSRLAERLVREWAFRLDEGRPEPRDSYAFFAGATFKNRKETILGSPNAGQWVAARVNDRFELFEAWYWRLWRVLYPEQLLAQETLEEQATYLSEWIIDAYQALAASPPTA
jgi:hypothetical protein